MADDAPRPDISVAMIAYQQDAFIAQAIDSVLMQDVDRSIELVIGDDCSSDRTGVILAAYARARPMTIRLLPTPSRLGAQHNFARTLKACRGRYIALLEADDFWTDRLKLRRQAEYLDTHPSCSMCFHNAKVQCPDRTTLYNAPGQKPVSKLEDLFQPRHFMATCSVMYRAGLFGEFPAWFYSLPCGDWPLYVLNAQHGTIGYIDEVMATYRKHGDGLWSGLSAIERLEMRLQCYPTLLAHAGPAYLPAARPAMSELHYLLALRYARRGRVITACGHAIRSIVLAPRQRREWLKPFGRFIQHRLRERHLGTLVV